MLLEISQKQKGPWNHQYATHLALGSIAAWLTTSIVVNELHVYIGSCCWVLKEQRSLQLSVYEEFQASRKLSDLRNTPPTIPGVLLVLLDFAKYKSVSSYMSLSRDRSLVI